MWSEILSFEMEEGINGRSSRGAGIAVADALRILHITVSLGDPSSLVEHPATMTHRNVPSIEHICMGISNGSIRFSVDLEDPENLFADLQRALNSL